MRRPGYWRAWADAAERPERRTSATVVPVAFVWGSGAGVVAGGSLVAGVRPVRRAGPRGVANAS